MCITPGQLKCSLMVTMWNLLIANALTTIVLLYVSLAGCGKTPDESSVVASCDYYASPSGAGNGLSQTSPFKISNFWSKASPGKTMCLLDGIYIGQDSMIDPWTATAFPSESNSIKGTSSNPITIKALNEGKVLIDGQSMRTPIKLLFNDWFVVEGINARNGNNDPNDNGSVVRVGSNNTIVRRVVAWDAGDTNAPLVGVTGDQNLLEDVAAFGIARKVFDSAQGGDFTTCRRCWGRWEGSHFLGPKHTFTLTYNNYDMTIENSIGAWSGEKMMQSYSLKCTTGDTSLACNQAFTNFDVDQPGGIFSLDRIDPPNPQDARSQILGSIAYLESSDRFQGDALILVGNNTVGALGLFNTVAFIEPGSHSTINTIKLENGQGNYFATGLTSVGGSGMTIANPPWNPSQIAQGQTVAEVGSIFVGVNGANVCKRYKDRVLTKEPLWPWPMDQRIHEAMFQAGRTPFYVTEKIEAMFGPIPSECKSAN